MNMYWQVVFRVTMPACVPACVHGCLSLGTSPGMCSNISRLRVPQVRIAVAMFRLKWPCQPGCHRTTLQEEKAAHEDKPDEVSAAPVKPPEAATLEQPPAPQTPTQEASQAMPEPEAKAEAEAEAEAAEQPQAAREPAAEPAAADKVPDAATAADVPAPIEAAVESHPEPAAPAEGEDATEDAPLEAPPPQPRPAADVAPPEPVALAMAAAAEPALSAKAKRKAMMVSTVRVYRDLPVRSLPLVRRPSSQHIHSPVGVPLQGRALASGHSDPPE